MRSLVIILPLLAVSFSHTPLYAALPYPIIGTGQTKSYDVNGEITPPKPGQPFYGQDAQYPGQSFKYALSTDGVTVQDQLTDLTWQRSPDTDGDGLLTPHDKLTWTRAQAWPTKLNTLQYGGYNDWRLPTIKELYSLFNACGLDPSGPFSPDPSRLLPFIDTRYFVFAYGDTHEGERIIDAQYLSCTQYVGKSPRGGNKLFGVNFADGRIKGYDLLLPGGMEKTFYVLCVRGNSQYGKNDFRDMKDGTITDLATGLMWAKADSGRGMNWPDALDWVQKMNAEQYLGYSDWRMPDIKELQSIVDYTRSPATTNSAAMDPLFDCTAIKNEVGETDYAFYWSATTHVGLNGGAAAMYIAFGRAGGWLKPHMPQSGPPGSHSGYPGELPHGISLNGNRSAFDEGNYQLTDIHGAGAQRSDPKVGDPQQFPHGRGPQGDVIRIKNFIRLVRDSVNRPIGARTK